MSDVSEVVGDGVGPALGGAGAPCPEFTGDDGRKWKIGWPTEDSRIWHELIVAKYAEDDLRARQRNYSKSEYAVKLKELETDLRAGHHRVLGSLWVAAINGPEAMSLFLLALLKEHQPEATIEDATELWASYSWEMRLKIAQVLPPFVVLLLKKAPLQKEERAAKVQEIADILMEQLKIADHQTRS